MRSPAVLAALLLLPACGGVGGDLSGGDFQPVTGYFGGPFIVFSAEQIDCMDLWWVAKNYDEDQVPWDQGFDILQITFNDADVVEGSFDVSGVSPVSAARIIGGVDTYEIDDVSSGLLVIDKVKEDSKVSGEAELQLGSGIISGSFSVGHCVNLSSAY